MGSLNSIKVRSELRHGVTESVVNDTPVAFRVKYIGTGSVTSVTVVTAVGITFISSDGETEAFTFATYTTMGALADAINNSSYWNAKLLDALRADVTASSPLNDGVIAVSGAGYYDATIDTSTLMSLTYRCAYDRNPDGENRVNSVKPKGAHRVHLQGFTYLADINAASANGVRVYEYNPVLQTETEVYQTPSVDNLSTTVTFVSGEGEISSAWGNDLIVRIIDGTSMGDTGLILTTSYDRE